MATIGFGSPYEYSFEYNIGELKHKMGGLSTGGYVGSGIPVNRNEITEVNFFGQSAFDNMGDRKSAYRPLPYANFSIGCELYVDDNIEHVFKGRLDGSRGGVVVACYTGEGNTAKALYFDYLDYTQPEFDTSNIDPKSSHLLREKTGKIICAKTEKYHNVYDIIHKCKTYREIWEAIKGRCLKVVDIIETPAGRCMKHRDVFLYNPIIGVREVPVFDFVEKNPVFWPDYDPRYFYKDYRIVCDEVTGKWGIINVKTNAKIVECVFDDIKWGERQWKSSPYNFDKEVSVDDDVDCRVKRHFDFVRFYKNGKKAIYRISDLENIGLMYLKNPT